MLLQVARATLHQHQGQGRCTGHLNDEASSISSTCDEQSLDKRSGGENLQQGSDQEYDTASETELVGACACIVSQRCGASFWQSAVRGL